MGTSLRGGKLEIAQWFKENEITIHRVLDIGAGTGTYATLIKNEHRICQQSEWVAIEAWQPYIEEFKLNDLYTTVVNLDVREIDWNLLGQFDITIAGDVLEHMTKNEAIELVEKILENSKVLIISIPIIYMPQDEVNGNPFEVHVKPDWSHDEVIETWPGYITHFYRKSPKSKLAVYWLSK
jgi:2-polyprenyl-3-methyl-5-hydroxy-6-metoxy-1,4-benzoquinol methylase